MADCGLHPFNRLDKKRPLVLTAKPVNMIKRNQPRDFPSQLIYIKMLPVIFERRARNMEGDKDVLSERSISEFFAYR